MACPKSLATALLTLSLGCASCGQSTRSTSSPAVQSPLTMSAARHLCPRRAHLGEPAALVLVPRHPTGALICRYAPLENLGLPGSLAGAIEVTRRDVTARLTRELDGLPPFPTNPAPSCPVLGDRSDLIIFHYRGTADATVRITKAGCIPVTNGRIVRIGIGLHMNTEGHWPDEGLL